MVDRVTQKIGCSKLKHSELALRVAKMMAKKSEYLKNNTEQEG